MTNKFVEMKSQTQNPDILEVQDVSPEEVFQKRNSIRLIDVRRPNEFEGGELGHIAGSELIVLDTLPMRIEELPKDETIVFICRSGNRSGQAAAFAQKNGFTNVYNMKGGMLAWNELQYEVEGRED